MPQLRKKWRFSEEHPEGNQSPPHEHDLALSAVAVQSDDGLKGLRSYVVRFAEIGRRRPMYMEVIGYSLLI